MSRAAPVTTAAVRTKVIDLELARPFPPVRGLHGYGALRALVRARGVPLGFVDLPLQQGSVSDAALRDAVERAVGARPLDETTGAPSASAAGRWPSVTVAVCTRDRASDLAGCLGALARVDYPAAEVLVVDNAPSDDSTAELVQRSPRPVRYVREPRPGLDWARNRAVAEARGEIVAFTDDDVVVDEDWLRALVTPFAEGDHVMAVAGLVVPLELETEAQVHFERYGGLSGGFSPIRLRGNPAWGARAAWHYAPVAQHFTGANLAFRREVFDRVGLFDPALDVGTPTNGGGDIDMVFRVLAAGFGVAYEPRALVRHRHRREHRQLRHQLSGWGTGYYAFLTRHAVASPAASWVFGLLAARGVWWQLRRLAASLITPPGFPRALIATELRGQLAGPLRYWRARRRAAAIARTFGGADLARLAT